MNGENDKGWWGRFYERLFSSSKRLDKGSTVEPFVSQSSGTGEIVDAESSLKLSAVWDCNKAPTVQNNPRCTKR